jgi:hypothetical protein
MKTSETITFNNLGIEESSIDQLFGDFSTDEESSQ